MKTNNPLCFLNKLSALAKIFEKTNEIKGLQQSVQKYLPENISIYCKVANRIDNRLVFITANSSVATSLRLESAGLLKKFKQDPLLKDICYIHCKVNSTPQYRLSSIPSKKMNLMSSETAKTITEIACGIDDPKLKAIMLKIASHHRKS